MPNGRAGRFTPADKSFINKYYTSKTPAEIAAELGRSESAIYNYIEKTLGVQRDSPMLAGGAGTAETIITGLRSTPEWDYIKKELTDPELQMFEQSYGKYVEQFEDEGNDEIRPTERTQIVLCVKLEILMHRLLRSKKTTEITIERLNERVNKLSVKFDNLSKDEKSELDSLESKICTFEKTKDSLNKEYMGYLEKHSDILKTMKATRDQRLKNIENSKVSFIDLLRQLQDDDVKEAEGREMELVKKSGENSYKKISAHHKFMDGQLEQPILNSETYQSDE